MGNDDMKKYEEDDSPLRDAVIQLHEMFEELKRAGFSRKEALSLVAKVLAASVTEGMGDLSE
jgi:putative heme degradation protein